MSLPRTFVGFSSTDFGRYQMMRAWKTNENIDFDFADFQLDESVNSENEYYIKSIILPKIRRADTYALLIGNDTLMKTMFVKWEVEVAIEKGCRLIGINLDNWRFSNALTCPRFFNNVGALFVPFSPQIVARALEPWDAHPPGENWYFYDWIYTGKGYQLSGYTATRPPPPNPFAPGLPRPPWSY